MMMMVRLQLLLSWCCKRFVLHMRFLHFLLHMRFLQFVQLIAHDLVLDSMPNVLWVLLAVETTSESPTSLD